VRLYELTAEYERLLQLASDPDPDEDDVEGITEALATIGAQLEQKAAGIGAVLAQLDAEASVLRQEEQRLSVKRRRIELNAERLREYVCEQMRARNIESIHGGTFCLKLKQCPPSVVVDNLASVPPEYLRHKPAPAPEVDKQKVLKAMRECGEFVPGTRVQSGVRLVVK
jgi:hypothetical protein